MFNASAVGNDQAYQFESWDTLQFTGFGYADSAAAISHMTVSGTDVVLADQGETITIHGNTLAQLQKANFIRG
ncbi:MAG: hypothetical protein JSS20_21790 [Proteobacteria bacterium]|nr:hypothetical protein [Pseudomonadota bacterium]